MELFGSSRYEELSQLCDLWEKAKSGDGPQFAVLRGKTGVGKTRLVQELYHYAATCEDQDYWPHDLVDPKALWQSTRKRIVPLESLRPADKSLPYLYWAISCRRQPGGSLAAALYEDEAQLVLHAGHLYQALRAKEIANRTVDAALVTVGILGALHIHVGSLAQVATATGALKVANEVFQDRWPVLATRLRERFGREHGEGPLDDPVEELVRNTAAVARQIPILLVVDDAHWADEETVRFLELLFNRPSLQLLIVATTWPTSGDADDRPFARLNTSHPRATLIDLQDLERDELGALADAALKDVRPDAPPLSPTVREVLCERFPTPMGIRGFFGLSQTQEYLDLGPLTLESLERLPKDLRAIMAEYWAELPFSIQKVLSYAAIAGMKFPVVPVVAVAELDDAAHVLERARQPHEFLRELDDYLGLFTDEHFHEAALDHKIVNPEPLYGAIGQAAAEIRDQDQLSPADETILATHLYFAQQGWVDVTEGAESGWRLAEEKAKNDRFSEASSFALQVFRLSDFETSLQRLGSVRMEELSQWAYNSGMYNEVIEILTQLLPKVVKPRSNRHPNEMRILLAKAFFETDDREASSEQLHLLETEWEPVPDARIHLLTSLSIAEAMISCELYEKSVDFLDIAGAALTQTPCLCGSPKCGGGASHWNSVFLYYLVTFQIWDETEIYLPQIRSQVEETWGSTSTQAINVRLLELEFYVQKKVNRAHELVQELQPLIDGRSTSALRVRYHMLRAILYGTLQDEDEMNQSIESCAIDVPHAKGTASRYIKWFNAYFG
jgi:hypothetical protein